MTNIDPTTWSLSDLKDVDSLNYYHELEKHHPGDEDLMKRAWQAICDFGRGEFCAQSFWLSCLLDCIFIWYARSEMSNSFCTDNARTPVQWTPDAATSAGFTTEGKKIAKKKHALLHSFHTTP